jgi:hypothetical protein
MIKKLRQIYPSISCIEWGIFYRYFLIFQLLEEFQAPAIYDFAQQEVILSIMIWKVGNPFIEIYKRFRVHN